MGPINVAVQLCSVPSLIMLLMSLLATALLWGTSLNIVTSVVNLDTVIPLPSMRDEVVHHIIKLVNETLDVSAESRSHASASATELTLSPGPPTRGPGRCAPSTWTASPTI